MKYLLIAILALSACANNDAKPGSLLDYKGLKKSVNEKDSYLKIGVPLEPSEYPRSHYSLGNDGMYHFNSVNNKR